MSATLEETLDLGAHMEALRRDSSDPDKHFDAIITLLWVHDPSGMPERTRLTLRNMGLEEAFDQYVAEHNRFMPDSDERSPGRWWVISYENCM